MSPNNTSFFDEPVEDESITLNDDELNNILEDSVTVASNEPDVIVIEKEKLRPSLDLSGSTDPDMLDADDMDHGVIGSGHVSLDGIKTDELNAAGELMDSPLSNSEETLYVEPGFEDESLAEISGITDASEISEITAFNDGPGTAEQSDDSALPVMDVPAVEVRAPDLSTPAVSQDEEISLSGQELENIISLGGSPVPESSELVFDETSADSKLMSENESIEKITDDLSMDTSTPDIETAGIAGSGDISSDDDSFEAIGVSDALPGEETPVLSVPVPPEGVVFSDEPSESATEIPAMTEEVASITDIPEITTAEQIEFENLDDDEVLAESIETLPEVAPIELTADNLPSSGEEVTFIEEPEETSASTGTVQMTEDPSAGIEMSLPAASEEAAPEVMLTEETAPEMILSDETVPETAAAPAPFAAVEEIDLDEPGAAPIVIAKAPSDNLKLYADEPAAGSFFSESDDDEAITLNTDELNNILSNADIEDKTDEMSEPADEPVQAQAPDLSGALSRDNLKEVFVYLDNLLDKLPDEEIKRFAESRYYDIYNQIFDELDIM